MSPYPLFSTNPRRHFSPIISFLVLSILLLLLSIPTVSGASTGQNFTEYVLRNVFRHKEQCYKDSFVYVKEIEADKPDEQFEVFSTTKACAERLKRDGPLPTILPDCPPGLVDLEVKPAYVARSHKNYPYADLNISVTAHSPVQLIAFRLECLSASDGTDVYCSDSKSMYIDGIKEWPCRALSLSQLVHYPARFSYACFRLTPHSIYYINATILPQRCRLHQLVTAPSFDDMFPDVLMEPENEQDLLSEPYWSPLLSIDLSDPTGVWVRIGKAEPAQCEKILINVYRFDSENKISFVQTLEIICPDTGVKWENLKAGKYLLTAYVPIRGCQFHCDAKDRSCHQCLRTHLNFLVPENRASLSWLAVQGLINSTYELFVGSLVLLGIVLIIVVIVCIIFCYRYYKASREVHEIQLREFVKAMVVYADDNMEHQGVVRVLVDSLRFCATCQPVFDVEELITAEPVVPSRWLVDQVCNLPKFVIVMSDCAIRILDTAASRTHRLVQNRPFADMFEPAIEMIIRDAAHGGPIARKKYAIVRFPYSPPVPANLGMLGFPVYNLPTQFGDLVAFLHDIPTTNTHFNQSLTQQRLQSWTLAVQMYQSYVERVPNWIEARWRPKEEPIGAFESTASPPEPLNLKTHEGRIKAAEKLGIHEPGEDSDDEEGPADESTFMLYAKKTGAVDSDSDSDASISDTKTLKPETSSGSPSPNNTAIYLGPGPAPPGTTTRLPGSSPSSPETSPQKPTTSEETEES